MQLKPFVFLLVLLSFLTSCIQYEEVEIKHIKSVKLVEFSDKGLVVESNIQIKNPNNFDLSVVDSEFDVFVKNNKIGKASIDSKVSIPSKSEAYHKVILRSDYKELAPGALPNLIALTALGSDKIDFKVDGFITGKAFFFKKKVHVTHEGKVPLKFY